MLHTETAPSYFFFLQTQHQDVISHGCYFTYIFQQLLAVLSPAPKDLNHALFMVQLGQQATTDNVNDSSYFAAKLEMNYFFPEFSGYKSSSASTCQSPLKYLCQAVLFFQ